MNTSMQLGADGLSSPPALAPAGMANLSRLSVLVADGDVAQSRRTLELLGGLEVTDVVCVQDHESALAWLRSRAFDVLLCSSRLGEQDGVELLQLARQVSPATRPVLIRTHSHAAQPPGIETLERPFSSSKLQALLSQTAAPLGGLWCEVPQLSLADILQMYHQGRRSITVLLSGPIAGRIRLVEGEIVHAESDGLQGLPALSRLLEADSGLLRTEATSPEGPTTVQGPFESTLLGAAQLLDERRRDRAAATRPASHSSRLNEPRPETAPSPSREFSEESPARRAKSRPLIFAFASALLFGVVVFALLARNIAVDDRDLRAARAQAVESNVQGLTARGATPPEPPVVSPVLPPAPISPPAPQQAQRAVSPSFELTISSEPSRARVFEDGKLLGRTPLTLTLERQSVARAPREFTLLQTGHEPHVIRQGDSAQDVALDVALQPLVTGNAGVLGADELEPARSPARRAPRGLKPRLDIRLRR